MQKVTVFLNDGEFEVHKAGCADISRHRFDSSWTLEASSKLEVAQDAWTDFESEWVAEGRDFAQDALGFTHFAPCVTLR